jgi:cytidylate kinase
MEAGCDPADEPAALAAAQGLGPEDLENPHLRGDEAAGAASQVAAIPAVRAVLLDFQRDFANRPPEGAKGAVLDGRDIGTVVCPEAGIKLFITASVEVRAERRVKELQERGLEAIYARVLQEMKDRDARDTGRAVAPLAAAVDALKIDTSGLDADRVFARAMDFIQSQDTAG